MNLAYYRTWTTAMLVGVLIGGTGIWGLITVLDAHSPAILQKFAETPEPVFAIAQYAGTGETMECTYLIWKPTDATSGATDDSVGRLSEETAARRLVPEVRVAAVNLRTWELFDTAGKQLSRPEVLARIRKENLVLISPNREIVDKFYRQFINDQVLIAVRPIEQVTGTKEQPNGSDTINLPWVTSYAR